jgi:hypothetical protein
LRAAHHAGHRWWKLDELTSATDVIYPFGLAPLLDEVLNVGIPRQAKQLPWHH